MQGAMKPFGGSFNLEALLICIYEEDQAALILDEAVKEMIAFYHSHDVNDLIPAVILTLGGLAQVKKGLPACEAIDSTQWNPKLMDKGFELMSKPTEHFEVKGNDVLVNGTGIKDDIIKAVEAYQAGEYEQFGEIIGNIAKLATQEKVITVAEQITKNNVAEFMQGMFKGTGVGSFNLEALLVCIYEEDQAALILYEAVQLLEDAYAQKDIGEAIGGTIALVAAVQQARQGLPACEAVDKSPMNWNKFDHMVSVIENPKTHMKVIGKDIIMNGRIITKDIAEALNEFRAGNFEQFGEKLGDALVKSTEEKVSVVPQISKENFAGFLQGILKATGVGSFNLEALLICVYEEDQAALILYEAVQLLEEAYAQKDIGEAIGGAIALVAAVQQARQGLPACEAIDKSAMNWTKFDQMVETCQNPMTNMKVIGKDIVMNGKVITKDLEAAFADYKAGDFEQFGEKLGDALIKSTETSLTVSPKITKENFAQFMQGMLKATGVGSFNLEALLVCIYEEDQAALILYEAVQLLEEAYAQKDIGEAIGGIIATIAGIQQARQGLPACEAIDQSTMNWTKFDQMVAVCENPKDNMKVIGKDIIFNGKIITKDIAQALDSFRSGDFEQFGEKLGDALIKTTTLKDNNNKQQVAQFQQGFLKATGVGSFNLEALLVCIYEEDQAALILYEAVQILEEAWSSKDPVEAIGGAIALVAAVQQARQGLPACEAIDTSKANWSTVDQILSVLESPKKNWNLIEDDITMNGANMINDLAVGLPAYKSKNYVQFGSSIGDLLALLTMPTNESDLFLF